jgi:hypothetical protein
MHISKAEGELAMRKHRIIWSALLLVLALGSQASRCAQDASIGTQDPDMEKRADMCGLVRTINTLEVTDFSQHGSYESWETLRERHLKDLNGWLARFYTRSANVHFGDLPEILPGWNLRLNVNADGQGYVLLLEDTADKTGYAALTDERAAIRECKYLQ